MPLKVALETRSILSVNANGTRIRHRTNTDPGSSGSPCFDKNWDLVALHHIGDPNFDPAHKPEWNEAIPVKAIRDLLTERKKIDALG